MPLTPIAIKKYTALLSQAGTNAPVAIIQPPNTLGTIIWTYDDVGTYKGTLANAFPNNKTVITIGSGQATDGVYAWEHNGNDDEILIYTTYTVDGQLYNNYLQYTPIKIEIHQ